MNEIIFLIEEAVEGGYNARALGESIFTQDETLEEIKLNIEEAVDCYFDEGKKPKLLRFHVVIEEAIAI